MKGAKLAEDLKFFCNAVEDGPDNVLWQVWAVFLDTVSCIPAGHPWQDSLVLSLNLLLQQDVPISKYYEVRPESHAVYKSRHQANWTLGESARFMERSSWSVALREGKMEWN